MFIALFHSQARYHVIKYYICGPYLINGMCNYKVNQVIKKGFFVNFHGKKNGRYNFTWVEGEVWSSDKE